ncbi:mCG1030237 [Mus musculus]|nr:mCG1030237 [Mus musculus]
MCVGMAGGQSVQGKRKEYDGWPGPSPAATNALQAGPQGRAAAQRPLAIAPVKGHMLKGPSCLPAPRPCVSLLVSGVSVCARV